MTLFQELASYNTPEVLQDSTFVPNPHQFITVRGAREHNLKNISLVIPKNQLVVFSGLSGSGKSSLVFDTIYAEGQRRYVESLSSYARQFLGLKEKPDLDSIDGLSPAISIDQKSTANNPRSTVGTITEVYDYVRLLYAKIGKQHCAVCGSDITGESTSSMIEKLLNLGKIKSKMEFDENLNGKINDKLETEKLENSEIEIIMLSPIVVDQKGWHRQHLMDAKKNNFRRVRIDGQIMLLEEAEKMDLNKQQKHTIEIVVDRLTINLENKNRLIDSLEVCLKFGGNKCVVIYYDENGEQKLYLNKDRACPNGHGTPGELAPRLFSFNSPHGACTVCTGLGVVTEIDDTLVVPNHNLSITEGAIRPLSRMSLSGGWLTKMFETLSIKYNFKLSDPWNKLSVKNQKIILYGDDKFEGVITNLKRRYRESTSDASRRDIESYMTKHSCPACGGARLKPEALAVTVAGYNIAQIVKFSISQALTWFTEIQNNGENKPQVENKFGNMLVKSSTNLNSKNQPKLILSQNSNQNSTENSNNKTNLERNPESKSQNNLENLEIEITPKILQLAQTLWDFNKLNQKLNQNYDIVIVGGSGDINVAKYTAQLYKDGIVKKLIFSGSFNKSQNWPKTEAETFANIAIDLGVPKADILVENRATNTGENVTFSQKLITDKKLKADKILLIHKPYMERRFLATFEAQWIGKSEVLVTSEEISLQNYLQRKLEKEGKSQQEVIEFLIANTGRMEKYPKLGFQSVQKVPAKVQKALEELIKMGFDADIKTNRNNLGNNLVNSKEKSQNQTETQTKNSKISNSKVENQIPNVENSDNSNSQVLFSKSENSATKLSNKDLEISKMIVKEIILRLQFLQNVGLKYLNLGRSADTLSGGEAQRIRLATQIGSGLTGVLYILDEPSIGLHQRDNDKLLETLEKLRDLGNTVIVVEHDEDTMRRADYLIDIGPKAGKLGGHIVAIGTPQEVMNNPNSPTGQFLTGEETINTPKNRREVNIKGLKDVPKNILIKELKEEWLGEIENLVKK